MNEDIWPDDLVESLARRDCVIFVGAGFSKNATSSSAAAPPSWKELLLKLLDTIYPKNTSGRRASRGQKIQSQINAGDLLWAAQELELEYSEKGKSSDFRGIICRSVDGPKNHEFEPGEVHDTLLDLNSRLVITTNYDKVIERLFGVGYVYLDYSSDAIADTIRSGREVVLRLHGSVDYPDKTVLTRLDFSRLRKNGSQAISVLEALSLTRTVLFLGYSLDDPDLQLVLENQVNISGGTASHYRLASAGSVPDSRKKVMNEAFGVNIIPYRGHNGSGFQAALTTLVDRVTQERVNTQQ